ncbi:MAG: 1-(5-phosphoribosyl)-5-[(5-phosphoribosylamino)methylideneamino]imidazole-4-carboxamide isomerase [Gammaproteobacteria bacterium]
MEVIPAIDLLGGRCVRLYKGDFDKVTEYSWDARELAARYRDAGLDRLHVVDLDGAKTGTPAHLEVIKELSGNVGVALQVGGGIRERAQVDRLLEAGADRVVIGSTAVKEPQKVMQWITELGAERIVLGLDIDFRDGLPMTLTHGWTETSDASLWTLLEQYVAAGARHVLCTDISRDGTLNGPNTDLYTECHARFPDTQFIASGGISEAAELPILKSTGAASVVTGKALLDNKLTLEEIQQFLRDA